MTIHQALISVVNYDMYLSQLFEGAIKAADYPSASIYADFHEFLHSHCADLIRIAQVEAEYGPFRLDSDSYPDDNDHDDDDSITGLEVTVGPDGTLS